MVIPRAFSSGALSIWSNATTSAPPTSASTFVMAAVRVVLPWSTWPIVPMFRCSFARVFTSYARVDVCQHAGRDARHAAGVRALFRWGERATVSEPAGVREMRIDRGRNTAPRVGARGARTR